MTWRLRSRFGNSVDSHGGDDDHTAGEVDFVAGLFAIGRKGYFSAEKDEAEVSEGGEQKDGRYAVNNA